MPHSWAPSEVVSSFADWPGRTRICYPDPAGHAVLMSRHDPQISRSEKIIGRGETPWDHLPVLLVDGATGGLEASLTAWWTRDAG